MSRQGGLVQRAWVPAGALAYLLALAVGLAAQGHSSSLSLLWPAAGAAVLWLLGAAPGARRTVLGLLVLLTVAANLLNAVPVAAALLFGPLNALHALVAVAVLRARGWTAPRLLRDVRDLGDLLLAAAAGAGVSAPLGALVAALAFDQSWPQAAGVLFVRNAVSTLTLTGLLLALPLLRERDPLVAGAARPAERYGGLLAALLLTWTVVQVDLPLEFLVLGATVWAGTRTGVGGAALLGLGQGGLVVLAALQPGEGAFASASPVVRVLLAQVLLAVLAVVGLWLALAAQERERALSQSRAARDRLQRNVDAALVGQAVLDVEHGRPVVLTSNPALRALLRTPAAALHGRDLLELVAPQSQRALLLAVEQLRDGVRSTWHGSLTLALPAAGGRPAPTATASPSATPEEDETPVVEVEAALGASGSGRVTAQLLDVTARRRAEARLSHLALHDELTGLPNRALWRDRVAQAMAVAERTGSLTGLLAIDLDRFKAVNDEHGHEVGDLLLVEVARRLRSAVRPQDTVARIGGDEFVVLCPDLPSAEQLEEIGRRLLASVGPVIQVGPHRLPVTASVGSALPGSADESAELGVQGLLRQADTALYAAKRAGRSRLVAFADTDDTDAAGGLLPELRQALAAGQLVPHYQPVVDLVTGRPVGMEALVRWHHPVRGLLPPSAWLEVLEASDLIHPLGQLVLEQACTDAAALRASGRELGVHVNVSAQELDRPGLVERVGTALDRSGLPAHLLTLELTETRLLTIEGSLLRELEAVRALGVRLAVDDFGTGYSALAHLVQMPVDVLKLDKGFVAGLGGSRSAQAVSSGVIAMARALEVECVAEGVERPEQARELLRLGYSVGQGSLWSGALELPALERWLAERLLPAPRAGARTR